MSKDLKRKRLGQSKITHKKAKVDVSKPQNTRKRVVIRSDALKWKEAELPDRLDDAEGFYGLEEIDDIEIVKDESGQISFRTSNIESAPDNDVVINEHDEEWSGFDDDVHSQPVEASPTVQDGEKNEISAEPASSKQNPVRGEKKSDLVRQDQKIDVEESVDFAALANVDDDSSADVSAWRDLELSPDLMSAISGLGFSHPTPIQQAAIPPAREGRDVIGKAMTGSGKTLAFGIPIIEKWLETRSATVSSGNIIPTALILAPTRELAQQLTQHLAALCKGLDSAPRIVPVTGGLSIIKQQRQLEQADIIVGTPGRLWEVINTSHGLIDRLRSIQFLVIDEADRLLSEGHFKEVEEILSVLDKQVTSDEDSVPTAAEKTRRRQTLVFSATFQKDLQQKLSSKQKWKSNETKTLSDTQSLDYLIRKLKFQKGIKPTLVDANPAVQMAEKLSESILECGAMQKDLYLYSLMLKSQHAHAKVVRSQKNSSRDEKMARTLVFTNSISTVKRLVPLLTNLSIPATTVLPLHSSMPQKSRLRSLEKFTSPPDQNITTAILIATDVAARGLDIKGIDTIIHYHVPRTADTYVHRSGRTARSTSSGQSVLICSPEEVAGVTRLISKVHSEKFHRGKQNQSRPSKATIQPLYLPANLPQQLQHRVSLGQKITDATLDTEKTNSNSNFLRTAAEELGVDYSSDDFDEMSTRHQRGRGGGREKKRKENVLNKANGKANVWKAELKVDLKRNAIDFGDGESIRGGGKFLAGGAVDMEKLLRERG